MPVSEFISFMSAANWIDRLARKYISRKRSRSDEIDRLANIFDI